MKVKLHVHYCNKEYIEGFRYLIYESNSDEYIYLGEIEIDNPFDVPDVLILNNAKLETINAEIKSHKATINILENQAKDLLSIENKDSAEVCHE